MKHVLVAIIGFGRPLFVLFLWTACFWAAVHVGLPAVAPRLPADDPFAASERSVVAIALLTAFTMRFIRHPMKVTQSTSWSTVAFLMGLLSAWVSGILLCLLGTVALLPIGVSNLFVCGAASGFAHAFPPPAKKGAMS